MVSKVILTSLPVKAPLASSSAQVPPASSPVNCPNKSTGEFPTKSFSQKTAVVGVPVSGVGNTIISTVVDSSGHGLGNIF